MSLRSCQQQQRLSAFPIEGPYSFVNSLPRRAILTSGLILVQGQETQEECSKEKAMKALQDSQNSDPTDGGSSEPINPPYVRRQSICSTQSRTNESLSVQLHPVGSSKHSACQFQTGEGQQVKERTSLPGAASLCPRAALNIARISAFPAIASEPSTHCDSRHTVLPLHAIWTDSRQTVESLP